MDDNVFRRARLPMLDGLRLVAMLEVVRYHAGATPLLDGVEVFFVLSGFLFALLLNREVNRTGEIDLKSFHIRRISRIYPAYFCALAVVVGFKWLVRADVDYTHLLASMTAWGNYYNASHAHPATGFSSYWTLAIEQQFYLVVPLLFLLFARPGHPSKLIRWLIGLGLASAGWRWTAALGTQLPDAYIYNSFETRVDAFLVGALCSLWIESGQARRWFDLLTRRSWYPIVTLLMLVLIGIPDSRQWRFTVAMTFGPPLVACLIVQLISFHEQPIWRWLDSPWARYGGALSFSGYLYHHLGIGLGRSLPIVDAVSGGILCTFCLAAMSYHLVELPAHRLLRSRRQSVSGSGADGLQVAVRNPAKSTDALVTATRVRRAPGHGDLLLPSEMCEV